MTGKELANAILNLPGNQQNYVVTFGVPGIRVICKELKVIEMKTVIKADKEDPDIQAGIELG